MEEGKIGKVTIENKEEKKEAETRVACLNEEATKDAVVLPCNTYLDHIDLKQSY